jgi:type IV pilus assembly protein PilX
MKARALHPLSPVLRRSQRGMVMVITLVVLVLLMLGAVTVFRSSDASGALSGQMALRRDLKNEGERGIANAITLLKSGALQTEASRYNSALASNYSATLLNTNGNNAQGLPDALMLSDADFTATGMTAGTLDATTKASVRTVIDRMCSATGAPDDTKCVRLELDCSGKGGQDQPKMGGQVIKCSGTAYRISVRVDGPRSTQAFFQAVVAQ